MNKRREQIISHLLNQRLMTVKDLALEFGAGERTIRNDFRELNSYLEASELGPVEVEKGRLVSAEDFDQVRLLQDTEDLYPYKLTQSERTGLAGILLGWKTDMSRWRSWRTGMDLPLVHQLSCQW